MFTSNLGHKLRKGIVINIFLSRRITAFFFKIRFGDDSNDFLRLTLFELSMCLLIEIILNRHDLSF